VGVVFGLHLDIVLAFYAVVALGRVLLVQREIPTNLVVLPRQDVVLKLHESLLLRGELRDVGVPKPRLPPAEHF